MNKGELNGNATLTEQRVKKIREDRKRNPRLYSYTKLAIREGVSFSCIRDIIKGRTWV